MDDWAIGKEVRRAIREVKDILNKLTGIVPPEYGYRDICKCHSMLDELLSPRCPECGVAGKRVITSLRDLYGIDDHPSADRIFWTGEYYCPKCRRTLFLPFDEGEENYEHCNE